MAHILKTTIHIRFSPVISPKDVLLFYHFSKKLVSVVHLIIIRYLGRRSAQRSRFENPQLECVEFIHVAECARSSGNNVVDLITQQKPSLSVLCHLFFVISNKNDDTSLSSIVHQIWSMYPERCTQSTNLQTNENATKTKSTILCEQQKRQTRLIYSNRHRHCDVF